MSRIDTGFFNLRTFIINSKTLKSKSKRLIAELTNMTPEFKSFAVKLHLRLGMFMHAINLLRWYGMFKNDGRHNKELYFEVMKLIKDYLINRKCLNDVIKSLSFPNEEALRGGPKIKEKVMVRK